MKYTLLLALLTSFSIMAKIPKFKETKLMKSTQLTQGPVLDLDILIDLPIGQKINEGANSYIKIHEKVHGKGWTLVENINVRANVLIKGMDLNISQKLALAHSSSNIMVSATIVHCANDNTGGCYIDNFQKEFKREIKESQKAKLTFLPTKF